MTTEAELLDKVKINRVRRMAARQGLYVHKSRFWGAGYNGFMVYPAAGGRCG